MDEDYPKRVAADLRDARAAAGLSQADMAARLARRLPHRGVNASSLSEWENGRKMPGADVYMAVLDVAQEMGSALALRLRAIEERTNLLLEGAHAGRLRAPELARALIPGEPPTNSLSAEEARIELGLKYRGSVYHRIIQGHLTAYWWQGQTWIPATQVQALKRPGQSRTRRRKGGTTGGSE